MPRPSGSSRKTSARPRNHTAAANAARSLPVLPLRDVVFFPHVLMPLLVGRPASLRAIDEGAAGGGDVLLVAQHDAGQEEPRSSALFRTGVIARITQITPLPNGALRVLLEARVRARVRRFIPRADGSLGAIVVPAPLAEPSNPRLTVAAGRRLATLFEEYVELQRRTPAEVLALVQGTTAPERQAWAIAAHVPATTETRQALLESVSLDDLVAGLVQLVTGELEVLRLERKLDEDTRGALYQTQREYFLQEQLKLIHRELGHEDADDLSELEQRLATRTLPATVRARVARELGRLRRLPATSPEHTVARGLLDWVAALPWTERSEDTLDLTHARAVLDADHYGLDDVKDRILDFIAVTALVGHVSGPILCLVGPPGVGKTSLGRSIARALGRRFVRMSLGGVRDEAEIRGHRRTYIGALPGRVLQAMRRAEVVNPVILLDEVDKLGQDYRGDPAAALLEVLDPEQHVAFNDHYLEVDYDLSSVLFITTANSLAGIPEALRDRMEIIRIPGYLDQEKLAIAREHLLPRQLAAHGLSHNAVALDDDVLPALLRGYTREAGVRELERQLARLARKLARRTAEAGGARGTPLHVAAADLPALLGRRRYDATVDAASDSVGVARGLAYTTSGGETLDVEVSVLPGRGKVSLTGTLGDVMKESAAAAMSYVRSRAAALGVPPDAYRNRDVHIHIPDGATPKDGPSAGIAIAVAVASALSGIPVRGDVAMTGEVTLRGRVLAIGGLKEKSVAAHRTSVRDVIIPHANLHELEDVPAEVREAVRFHPVRSMDEVLALALCARPVARTTRRRAPAGPATPAAAPPAH